MTIRFACACSFVVAAATLVACGSSSSGTGGSGSGNGDGNGTASADGGATESSGGSAANGDAGDAGAATTGSDAAASGSLEEHTLAVINGYRAGAGNGAMPLVLDSQLDTFALAGSTELSQDHEAHAHFNSARADGSLLNDGFHDAAAENQGDPDGDDIATFGGGSESGCIDAILAQMFAEGPGGGHHDNMIDPASTRLGVGLVVAGGDLYFTNDFSP